MGKKQFLFSTRPAPTLCCTVVHCIIYIYREYDIMMETADSVNAFLYIGRYKYTPRIVGNVRAFTMEKNILQNNQCLIQSGNAICKLCWLQVENGKCHAACGIRI